MEWLGSPIVYVDRWGVAAGLRDQLAHCYSQISCGYHYLSMARNNYKGLLQGMKARMKKYFYVLRPLLALMWIERNGMPSPTEFDRLVEALIVDETIRREIDRLMIRKQSALETADSEAIPDLNRFTEDELGRLDTGHFGKQGQAPSADRLNRFFRDTLDVIREEPI